MDDILADIRFALRGFRQSPVFFAAVIGILALGIAASVAIFSLVDGVLLRPLPYHDPQRLITLTSYAPKPPFDSNGSLTYTDFEQFKTKAKSFEDLAVTYRRGWSLVTLTGDTEPVHAQGTFVSPNLFRMFGRSPLMGRTFTPAENLHAERVVVISEGLWTQRFGASPRVLGQDLEINKTRWRVIGVMPADFRVPFLDTQLWAPVRSQPEWNDPEPSQRWDVMARLKPAVSLTAAQAEVDAIEHGLKQAAPESHSDNVRVVPLRESFTESVRKPMLVLFSAVAFLLLIACANVANLLLARAARREREFAVRTALGAGHARLWRQLITEATLFSLVAGALGIAGALGLVPLLRALAPGNTPLLTQVSLNGRSLAFALAVSLLLGLLLGCAPAWRSLRRNLGDSLGAAGRSVTENRHHRRFKSVLVAAEFALATVLLTGAGLMIRSFLAVLHVETGFHADNVLVVQMVVPNATAPAAMTRFYHDAMQRIAAVPGVRTVGGISNLFFLDQKRTHALRQVEGRPPEPTSSWKPLVWTQISGDYFQAMGIPLLRGRFFNAKDRPNTPLAAIVNENLARRYWPGQDPIGKRLKGFDPRGRHDDWLTVVGVVKDTRSGGREKPAFSQIYEVRDQTNEQIQNFVIRISGDPNQIARTARTLIHQANPDATISSEITLEQLLIGQTTPRRFQTWIIGVFSGVALALAALGIFAVMHYSVTAKTHEIGIRMAVGAGANEIVKLMLNQGVRLALIGIAVGILGAVWTTEAIAGLLYKVSPQDPLSFATTAVTLFVVALAACYLPARRASRVDPMAALRQE